MTPIRVPLKLTILLALAICLGAGPESKPAAPPDAPDLSPAQKALLLQLADAETNIQAINKKLVQAGYKVGLAYGHIDSNLKGNELMDRKGGGPVRWDAFYGKTAKDYGRNHWGDAQPEQFRFVYKANNDQINRAKADISSLGNDIDKLLARRHKHEEDQSSLWARLAWDQVKDREIALNPLCRFALKPQGPEAAVLRPVILFLRTADSVAIDGLELVKSDQGSAFQSASLRMAAAYKVLQESLADALEAENLKAEHRKEGQALKALCKELAEGSTVISENYTNALDRDQAKQDSSKLEFRGHLQESLATFASAVGRLDDEVTATAKVWEVVVDRSTKTQDVVAAAPVIVKAERVTSPSNVGKGSARSDALQPGTIWSGTSANGKTKLTLTVLERIDDRAKVRFEVGPDKEGIVWGRVADARFSFLGKDVRVIKGPPYHDNVGTIRGNQIDFEVHDDSGKLGEFTLRLDK